MSHYFKESPSFLKSLFRFLATFVVFLILASWLHHVVNRSYTHYRLPVTLQPDRYQLKIITHLENPANSTFNGEVAIRFQALEDTKNITLHVRNLTIDDSRIQLQSYVDDEFRLSRVGIETVPQHDYYIIRLRETLRKGHMYKVKLYFSGVLSEELLGYYRSSYVYKATNETRWLSVTHFEPTYARTAFPCFDEPIFKANFTIWLGHHKSLTALSNMPLEKQIPMDELDDFVWSIFEESAPMSTYLVAYTVNDFAYKESKAEGSDVVFRTWSTPDKLDQCDYAAESAPRILQYYEQMFNIPYPGKKVDQIAIPDYKGFGMENWGLITYREVALLFAPNVSSSADKNAIGNTIAHELAHQWFGNLVTMKWWKDLWLKEGFATYIATLGRHHLNPNLETYNEESLYNSQSIFFSDAKLDNHPLSPTISSTSQIATIFDWISYTKGSTVVRMMQLLLDHDVFFQGVSDYLRKHQYKNAEQDDLWAAFTQKAHKYNCIKPQHDIKTIMDSWTLQKGYPLVNVSRNYATGTIEIVQHRFLENSSVSGEEAKGCWWVPLSYTTASELDFMTTTPKDWLECDDAGKSVTLKLDNVTDANEWIIFNIQVSGVYRVMYDTDNWRLLHDTLNSDKFANIHVMNRAQIVYDVLSFAGYGYLDYGIAFDVLKYLTREREYLPWQSVAADIGIMFSLLQHFPQHHVYFKAYMRYIIAPIYYYMYDFKDHGEISTTHSHIALKKLVTNWACFVELDHWVHTAKGYFQKWKLSKKKDNNIPVDWRNNIYCTAIRHGDNEDWVFLWQRYKDSSVDEEKTRIAESLGCSRNETILRGYIELISNKNQNISTSDTCSALSYIASNDIGTRIALEYYIEHSVDLGVGVVDLLDQLSFQIVSIDDVSKLTKLIGSKQAYFKQFKKKITISLR